MSTEVTTELTTVATEETTEQTSLPTTGMIVKIKASEMVHRFVERFFPEYP